MAGSSLSGCRCESSETLRQKKRPRHFRWVGYIRDRFGRISVGSVQLSSGDHANETQKFNFQSVSPRPNSHRPFRKLASDFGSRDRLQLDEGQRRPRCGFDILRKHEASPSCAEETLREDCVLYTREMWIEVEQSDREKFNSWVDERDRYSGRQDTLVAMLVWITPPFAIVSLLVVWALGPSQKRSA